RLRPSAQDARRLAGAVEADERCRARAAPRGADRAGAPARRASGAPLPGGVSGARSPARMMSGYRALAPAKVNLGLCVGPVRAGDGRDELVTVLQAISLADELELTPAAAGVAEDEVWSPGVPGPPSANLAAAALRSFRAATGWDAPPVRLEIAKRLPLAAGPRRGPRRPPSPPP